MNPALIAAIAAGLGSVIGVVGKVIVDVIRANHEPDQADLELKDAAPERLPTRRRVPSGTPHGMVKTFNKIR